MLLAAGRLVEVPVALWGLIDALVPRPPPADVDVRDPRFLLALYAALAVAELGPWRAVSEQEEKLGRIRGWLAASLELGALAPKDRAEGGRVLARLADPREGVGVDAKGVPEIAWVKIPAGSFLMGDEPKYGEYVHDNEKPQHAVSLPRFRISRYPVTNGRNRSPAPSESAGSAGLKPPYSMHLGTSRSQNPPTDSAEEASS